MKGIGMFSFLKEIEKISQEQMRDPGSVWAPKTIGAPRSKVPTAVLPKPPTAPGNLSAKLIGPASTYGPRQNYSQPVTETAPSTQAEENASARLMPPPNVVYGVR